MNRGKDSISARTAGIKSGREEDEDEEEVFNCRATCKRAKGRIMRVTLDTRFGLVCLQRVVKAVRRFLQAVLSATSGSSGDMSGNSASSLLLFTSLALD